MKCLYNTCRWNYNGCECGFPYEISINEDGICDKKDDKYLDDIEDGGIKG